MCPALECRAEPLDMLSKYRTLVSSGAQEEEEEKKKTSRKTKHNAPPRTCLAGTSLTFDCRRRSHSSKSGLELCWDGGDSDSAHMPPLRNAHLLTTDDD